MDLARHNEYVLVVSEKRCLALQSFGPNVRPAHRGDVDCLHIALIVDVEVAGEDDRPPAPAHSHGALHMGPAHRTPVQDVLHHKTHEC